MKYKTDVTEGEFLLRYKRFFADIKISNKLNSKTVTAHVPNTGALANICDFPAPCRITKAEDPDRKLQYTLEQVKTKSSWVGVNTHFATTLAYEAFQNKIIPHWAQYNEAQREVKLNEETRLDMKLNAEQGNSRYVEVKSVTMARGTTALFPDAETTRGQKHLRELINLAEDNHSAELFFIVQREDCTELSPADDIDPEYGRLLREAFKQGVKISVYATRLTEDGIEINTDKELTLTL